MAIKVHSTLKSANSSFKVVDATDVSYDSQTDVKTKIDDLEAQIAIRNDFSGSYNDLTDKPVIPVLDGYATETYVNRKIADASLNGGSGNSVDTSQFATRDELQTKASIGHIHSYNDLTDKPVIPTRTSQLVNDSGFSIYGGESSSSSSTPLPFVSPRETNGNVQAAIDLAVSRGCHHVILEGKEYKLSTTLKVPSRFTLEGCQGQTRLTLTGVNKPVIMTSTTPGTGYVTLRNFMVIGDQTMADNDGILFRDYWSTIDGIEVKNCGGCGIVLDSSTSNGTQVEIVVRNCIVRGCKGTSFQLGTAENNKTTDGLLLNCISLGTGQNKAVQITNGAGWQINNLHTYGHADCDKVIDIKNAFNTHLDNIYMEEFRSKGICCSKVQKNLLISNISGNIKNTGSTQSAIYLSKSSAFSYRPNISITNVAFDAANSATTYVVDSDGSDMKVTVVNVTLSGNYYSSAKVHSSKLDGKITLYV